MLAAHVHSTAPTAPASRAGGVAGAIVALGFAAAVVQLAMMRELLANLAGNELTLGIALSCWLVLTAVGTQLGGRGRTASPRAVAIGVILVAATGIIEVLALRAGRELLLGRGTTPDPLTGAVACLVVLAPFCIGSGALLAQGCRALAQTREAHPIGRIYAADAMGSIAGALVFTLGLSRVVDHAAAACAGTAVAGIAIATLRWTRDRRTGLIAGLVGAAFGALTLLPFLDAWSTQWQHRGRVVYRTSSPYGRLVVTQNAGQLTFFENGVPVVFTGNTLAREELVHFALAQRPQARAILLIGGGVGGAAREVLRYPQIQAVTTVELDPRIPDAARQLRPADLADSRIAVVVTDGRRFLQHSVRTYDVILVALPDPTTFQLNRFYTAEFCALAKRHLAPEGVLALGVGTYQNFVSPELRQLLRSTHATLATAFARSVMLPGTRVYFLASDGPLTRDIADALERVGINPTAVNRHYLAATLSVDRLADLDRALAGAKSGAINRDLHPILSWLRLHHWLSQFWWPAWGLLVALTGATALSLFHFQPVPRLVFAGGFAGAALEIVVLVAYQALYGSVYQQVGLIVALFMTGLAGGAALANRVADGAAVAAVVRVLAAVIAALAAMLPLGLRVLTTLGAGTPPWAGQLSIGGFTVVLAAAIGAQFAWAGRSGSVDGAAPSTGIPRSAGRADALEPPARLFSADLVGAALGALAVSAVLLPWYGASTVCFLTAALNVLAVAVSFRTPHLA